MASTGTRRSHNQCNRYVWISARDTARAIILSRSRRSPFLLSSLRSAGIDEYAVSIAMSFASAKLILINFNSCSILSNVWSDKSFPKSINGYDYRHLTLAKQRRSAAFGATNHAGSGGDIILLIRCIHELLTPFRRQPRVLPSSCSAP